MIWLIPIIFASGCTSVIAPTTSPGEIKAISSRAIIHKKTQYFIDIEVPIEHSWVGCSDDDPKSENSLMLFYGLDGDESHEFHYRRIYDVPMCLEAEREYHQIMKSAKTVRLVGHHPTVFSGPKPPVTQRVPQRFSAPQKITWWTFSRLQVGDQCKAYFPIDCDHPKNYWVGVIPE